ncbi:uncharacterized protein LOC143181886 [Calliopsis andreniformis]|uniref:uncharacterized protein LOC143181886 n=1 Tax=Calliopsis andreniformis TaxID=337506 RepID=UPI003FCEBE92
MGQLPPSRAHLPSKLEKSKQRAPTRPEWPYSFAFPHPPSMWNIGICATITSDCGTNFKGADQKLKDLFSKSSAQLKELASLLAMDGIVWNFNHSDTPHFGGKWEAGVKSVKHHLKRVTGNAILTYEEMSILLIKIEAVLNSRLLCPPTDHPADLEVLTPGHFPIEQPLTLVPEPNMIHGDHPPILRWQRITQILQSFWAKWLKGYLQHFQAMYKWNKSSPNLIIETVVLILDDRYPPSKTSTSLIKWPVTKVCPLPITAVREQFLACDNEGGRQ